MNNLLSLPPAFSDAKVSERLKSWQPHRADPADDKNIPFGLEGVFSRDVGKGRYSAASALPVPEPNHRNVVRQLGADPSPLSALERGVVSEATLIAMPKDKWSQASTLLLSKRPGSSSSSSSKEKVEPLLLQLNNMLEDCMEVYIQRASVMQLSTLRPNMKCERSLTDTRAASKSAANKRSVSSASISPGNTGNSPFAVLFSTVHKLSATITGRHEVRAFEFLPGPIGIEVEVLYHRLICTRVVPDSQAYVYEDALNGSEILSVNGERVLTLEEFQQAVVAAYGSGSIVIGAAAYRSRSKKDFAHFIGSTKIEFKSLLSNIMKSGIDKDHQHDLGQTKAGDDDSDDESSDSDESTTGGQTEEDNKAVRAEKEEEGQAEDKREGKGDVDVDVDVDVAGDGDGDVADVGDSDEEDRPRNPSHKHTYVGVDDDGEDGGMMVRGRASDRKDVVLYSPREDIGELAEPLLLETEAEEDNDQEVIEVGPDQKQQQPRPSSSQAPAKEAWDYTTALEQEEAVPFSTIVCMPRIFQRSLGWGDPQKCIQFTNYSSKWDVQVCWIDEESAVVPRTRLRCGQKHVELTSPKHLWILIATATDSKKSGARGGADEGNSHIDSYIAGTAMLLRPSTQSLGTRKYTSAMWVPDSSFTVTQRLRAKVPPAHKQRGEAGHSDSLVQPSLLVSIFEGGH